MININQDYKDTLIKYFDKNIYDTNEKLKETTYTNITETTKNFLLNLPFENNGKIKSNTLFSEQTNNGVMIETFFRYLTAQYGANARDIFITTPENVVCNYSSTNIDEQVKCIKKFLIDKYSNMYENMRSVHGKKLIQSSNLFVCPYCHRSYIGVIESQDGSRNITPDLDHFYPKSRYPFLAVTLSNLIPSCLFCNQRSKKNIDFYKSSIYPPQTIFDNIEFDFDPYTHKIYINNYAALITNAGSVK
ncbi:MAG: HNH endonuclease [Sulfuricurvum sp.]